MAENFLPSGDDNFNHFLTDFMAYATANAAACGLTPAQLTALTAAVAPWMTDYPAYTSATNAANVAREAKDIARAATESALRQTIAAIQANPVVTDATRVGLGIPVHKTTHTPVGDLTTYPVLVKVEQGLALQRLWFADQTTPGSKGKPKGAALCEIREVLVAAGGAAPTDPGAMPYLASVTKTPYRNSFEAGDAGKTAYYCQRWQNTKGVPGPWGPISGWVVT